MPKSSTSLVKGFTKDKLNIAKTSSHLYLHSLLKTFWKYRHNILWCMNCKEVTYFLSETAEVSFLLFPSFSDKSCKPRRLKECLFLKNTNSVNHLLQHQVCKQFLTESTPILQTPYFLNLFKTFEEMVNNKETNCHLVICSPSDNSSPSIFS